jgi:flagellar biosynthesis protein FlhB
MAEPRTEEPTPRKLAEARARAQVATSPLLSAGMVGLATVAVLTVCAPALRAAGERLARAALSAAAVTPARVALASVAEPLRDLGWALLPVLLVPCAAALLAGVLQVGPLFASGALRPSLSRVDPRSRWRGLWSGDRMLEVSYSTLTACVLLALLAWWLKVNAAAALSLSRSDPHRALSVLARLIADIVLRMGVAVVLFGTIDLALRRVRARRALRMSRRELRAEQRESYGHPEPRARRERLLQEARATAEINAVQDARLVLVDPAGRIVAIGLRDRTPFVLAKGVGPLALRVRAVAAQAGVPEREHAALVSALFRCELGDVVHADLYAELAESFIDSGAG